MNTTAQSVVEWSKDLPPGTVLLVSPYGHLIASAEVAMTPSWELVEAVYRVWELDNRQQPGSVTGRRAGDGGVWTRWVLPTASVRRRFTFEAGVDSDGPVPNWLLRTFCDWASLHVPSLDALTSAISSPQIVKVLLYAGWGMQAMNARLIGNVVSFGDDDAARPLALLSCRARISRSRRRLPEGELA